MNYKVFSSYYQLALQGRVPDLLCQKNIGHPTLVPNLENEDKIVLRCIDPDCNYKIYPGDRIYKMMLHFLEEIGENSV